MSNPDENEELTDTAAVLAGFGPLMRQAAFRQVERRDERGQVFVRSHSIGYLHRDAIERLMMHRLELSKR